MAASPKSRSLPKMWNECFTRSTAGASDIKIPATRAAAGTSIEKQRATKYKGERCTGSGVGTSFGDGPCSLIGFLVQSSFVPSTTITKYLCARATARPCAQLPKLIDVHSAIGRRALMSPKPSSSLVQREAICRVPPTLIAQWNHAQ